MALWSPMIGPNSPFGEAGHPQEGGFWVRNTTLWFMLPVINLCRFCQVSRLQVLGRRPVWSCALAKVGCQKSHWDNTKICYPFCRLTMKRFSTRPGWQRLTIFCCIWSNSGAQMFIPPEKLVWFAPKQGAVREWLSDRIYWSSIFHFAWLHSMSPSDWSILVLVQGAARSKTKPSRSSVAVKMSMDFFSCWKKSGENQNRW